MMNPLKYQVKLKARPVITKPSSLVWVLPPFLTLLRFPQKLRLWTCLNWPMIDTTKILIGTRSFSITKRTRSRARAQTSCTAATKMMLLLLPRPSLQETLTDRQRLRNSYGRITMLTRWKTACSFMIIKPGGAIYMMLKKRKRKSGKVKPWKFLFKKQKSKLLNWRT